MGSERDVYYVYRHQHAITYNGEGSSPRFTRIDPSNKFGGVEFFFHRRAYPHMGFSRQSPTTRTDYPYNLQTSGSGLPPSHTRITIAGDHWFFSSHAHNA